MSYLQCDTDVFSRPWSNGLETSMQDIIMYLNPV